MLGGFLSQFFKLFEKRENSKIVFVLLVTEMSNNAGILKHKAYPWGRECSSLAECLLA